MKLLHIVAGLLPAGGGISEAVPQLALEAARLGAEVTIATVAKADEHLSAASEKAVAGGVRIVRFAPSMPRALFFSWAMLRHLRPIVEAADVVHVHSNWTFPVWWGCRTAVAAGKPLVMSPRGCLDPVRLAHSAWKKWLAGFFDVRCLRQADVIHATSAAERSWIARYMGGRPRIEVIPNGMHVPDHRASVKPADRTRIALFLGRLHPLKGLDLLLDAWRITTLSLAPGGTWELVIAGLDEQGTLSDLKDRARRLRLENIRFAGPLYGDEKIRMMATADLFVLPSRSENFGNAVAEALAMEIPVITTTATPWAEIHGICGWCVEPATEPIAHALAAAMQLSDDQRTALGVRGRHLVAENYSWKRVGKAMQELYESVLGQVRR